MRVYKSDPPPPGSVRPAGLTDFHAHSTGYGPEFSAVEEEDPLTSSSKLSAGEKGQKRKNDDRG